MSYRTRGRQEEPHMMYNVKMQKNSLMLRMKTIWEEEKNDFGSLVYLIVCYGDKINNYRVLTTKQEQTFSTAEDEEFFDSELLGTLFYCIYPPRAHDCVEKEIVKRYQENCCGIGLFRIPYLRYNLLGEAVCISQCYCPALWMNSFQKNMEMLKNLKTFWDARSDSTAYHLMAYVGNYYTYKFKLIEYSPGEKMDLDTLTQMAEQAGDNFSIMYTLYKPEEYKDGNICLFLFEKWVKMGTGISKMMVSTKEVFSVDLVETCEWKSRNMKLIEKLQMYWSLKKSKYTDRLAVWVGNTVLRKSRHYDPGMTIDLEEFAEIAERCGRWFTVLFATYPWVRFLDCIPKLEQKWQNVVKGRGGVWRMFLPNDQGVFPFNLDEYIIEQNSSSLYSSNAALFKDFRSYWKKETKKKEPCVLVAYFGTKEKHSTVSVSSRCTLPTGELERLMVGVRDVISIVFTIYSTGKIQEAHRMINSKWDMIKTLPYPGVWRVDLDAGDMYRVNIKEMSAAPLTARGKFNMIKIDLFRKLWNHLRKNTSRHLVATIGDSKISHTLSCSPQGDSVLNSIPDSVKNAELSLTILFSICPAAEVDTTIAILETEWATIKKWGHTWRLDLDVGLTTYDLFRVDLDTFQMRKAYRSGQEKIYISEFNNDLINKLSSDWKKRKEASSNETLVCAVKGESIMHIYTFESTEVDLEDELKKFPLKKWQSQLTIVYCICSEWRIITDDEEKKMLNVLEQKAKREQGLHMIDLDIEEEPSSEKEEKKEESALRYNEFIVRHLQTMWKRWDGAPGRNLYCIVGNGRRYKAFVFTPLDMIEANVVLYSVVHGWKERVEVTCLMSPAETVVKMFKGLMGIASLFKFKEGIRYVSGSNALKGVSKYKRDIASAKVNMEDLKECSEFCEKLDKANFYPELSIRKVVANGTDDIDDILVYPKQPTTEDLKFRPEKLINGCRMKFKTMTLEHRALYSVDDSQNIINATNEFDEIERIGFDHE